MLKIACFGDSLIYGFPYSPDYSWTAVAGQLAGLELLNYGECGADTDDIWRNMRYARLPEDVRHVLFFGGANDIIGRCPVDVTLENINKVKRLAEEKGWQLCVVMPLFSGEKDANIRVAKLRDALSHKEDVFLLDLQPAVGTSEEELKAAYLDGWHPKLAVYQKMGELAAPLLQAWTAQAAEKTAE